MSSFVRFALAATLLTVASNPFLSSHAATTPTADIAVLVAAMHTSSAIAPLIQFEDGPTCNDSNDDGECDEGGFQQD